MLNRRRVWLVGAIVMLFLLSSVIYAVEGNGIRSILNEGTETNSSDGSSSYLPLSSGRESSPLPPSPMHPLSASQIIYIYVRLHQPPWLPPPPIRISEHNCAPALMEVKLDSVISGASRYNIYRDTLPMFYAAHYDSSHNLIGDTRSRYFDDYFTDALWYPIGSKGVCDPNINYFYIATTVTADSSGVPLTESARPSNCAGELERNDPPNP